MGATYDTSTRFAETQVQEYAGLGQFIDRTRNVLGGQFGIDQVLVVQVDAQTIK